MSAPASPAPVGRSLLVMLGALVVALGGLLALRWKRLRMPRDPVRILLVTEPPAPGAALTHNEMRAVATLFEDGLAMTPAVAVTPASRLPDHPEQARRHEPVFILRLQPERASDGLGLDLAWAWSRAGDLSPWTRRRVGPGPPDRIFRETFEALPLQLASFDQGAFLPDSPHAFWELVETMGLRLDNARLPEATERARRLVAAQPRCASAWLNLGNLLNRTLLDDPESLGRNESEEAEAAFERTLALVPNHARANFRAAVFRSSSGSQREALDLLVQAYERHPSNPLLLLGIVNAARNAGLLDLALRAADLHEHLTLPEFQPQSIQLLHLYREDLPRFEARLQGEPGQLRHSIVLFYRGYLPLLAGDRTRAREAFAACEGLERAIPNYQRLSKVFRLELDGQRLEARALLAQMERERTGLRVSDGEFTLRMAEAAAFLGELPLAMTLADRAYSQGFGCTRWYERSPLLAPIRDTPRFASLLQHLRERQAILEKRFPPSRFGL